MAEPLRPRLDYTFRQPELLRQALTHRSFGTPHNERMEFVGDAVLNCVVGAALYERFRRYPKAISPACAPGWSTETHWRAWRGSSISARRFAWAKVS